MRSLGDLNREELIELLHIHGLNWLAHDGCWFLAAEARDGWERAEELNEAAWHTFTRVEARRILRFLGRKPGGGTEALAEALGFRLYAQVNEQEIVERDDKRLVFRMKRCRVQETRKRKGLPLHRCKPAGIIEYTGFAETIDPRLRTRCIHCPPDPGVKACKWRFEL